MIAPVGYKCVKIDQDLRDSRTQRQPRSSDRGESVVEGLLCRSIIDAYTYHGLIDLC